MTGQVNTPGDNKQMWGRDHFISNIQRFLVYMSDHVDETPDFNIYIQIQAYS